jgi:transposase
VTDHDTRRIVWAMEGKSAATLSTFFEELGEDSCKKIEVISMDMSQAYISAAKEHVPQAQIVFDRFHVQQLHSAALDESRCEEWRRLREHSEEAAEDVKVLRWPLLKNPWNLTPTQSQRLSTLQQNNERLYRANLLKESFAEILDGRQPNVVKRNLVDWLSWASRSRLSSLVKVGQTMRKHLEDIVANVRWRLTNGLAEGLNTKVRMQTRRAYGFHTASALITMIMLSRTGLVFRPPRKWLEQPTRSE